MNYKLTKSLLLSLAVLFILQIAPVISHAQLPPDSGRQSSKEKLLFKAIRERELVLVKKLIAAGARVNARDEDGKTTLRLAAQYYKEGGEILKALIAADVDVKQGGLEAIGSSYNSEAEIIKILLKAGFDVNAKDEKGRTALFYTDAEGIELLLSAGANANEKDNEGRTPLMMRRRDSVEIKRLLDAGAKVNEQDEDGDNVFMFNAREGNIDILKALIDAGAEINMKDKNGQTALQQAKEIEKLSPTDKSLKEVVKFLKSVGAIDYSTGSK